MSNNYNGDLPLSIDNNGETINIRNRCDYRIVKKTIRALKDIDLEEIDRVRCALIIFYENYNDIIDVEDAVKQMFFVIGCENEYKQKCNISAEEKEVPPIMDWDYDWDIIAPEINKILGYEIRMPDTYVHWWTLVGAYKCIGEGVFNSIISIRDKKQKGKKMEKWEQEYYRENRKMIDLPRKLTAEEEEFLNSDW